MSMVLFRQFNSDGFLYVMSDIAFEYVEYPFYVTVIAIKKKRRLNMTPCEHAFSANKASSHCAFFSECNCMI